MENDITMYDNVISSQRAEQGEGARILQFRPKRKKGQLPPELMPPPLPEELIERMSKTMHAMSGALLELRETVKLHEEAILAMNDEMHEQRSLFLRALRGLAELSDSIKKT